ncbi:MAG: DUF3568 family protein [Thermoanaerobaculales bacterium]
MKKILILFACIGLFIGCKSTVVAPEGTQAEYSPAEGALRATLGGSMPEVVEATKTTLEDLDLVGIDANVDKLKGKITARMAVGKKVTINLEAIDFDTTKIKIKVGSFGDKSISMQILRHIQKQMK